MYREAQVRRQHRSWKECDTMKQGLLERLKEEKALALEGGLYHQTQVKLAFNSNRIEGSRLSEEQTRYIYETNTINIEPDETANVDDIIETVNHFSCFDYMLAHADEQLTEEMIKEFHRLLKRNTSGERQEWFRIGDYKARPNVVGDLEATSPAKVGTEIRKLLAAWGASLCLRSVSKTRSSLSLLIMNTSCFTTVA